MRVGQEYWHPPSDSGLFWAHAGITAFSHDRIAFAEPSSRQLVLFHTSGDSELIPFAGVEAHGIDPIHEGGRTLLWIADPGFKAKLEEGAITNKIGTGYLHLIDLKGETLYRSQPSQDWRPTSVAATDPGAGRSSFLWVADGYGSGDVILLRANGRIQRRIDGRESGITFDTPHAIAIDRRSSEPVLVVADRGNRRLVLFTTAGDFLAVVDALDSPSGLTFDPEYLYVAQLNGAISILDRSYRFVDELRSPSPSDEQWPNQRVDGKLAPPTLDSALLHSPHDIAYIDGRLYLTEWCLGGRYLTVHLQEN